MHERETNTPTKRSLIRENQQESILGVVTIVHNNRCMIAANFSFHECTKHNKIDCHLVREKLLAHLFRAYCIGCGTIDKFVSQLI